MKKTTHKSLYLFLAGLLGSILFMVVHRFLMFLYLLLLITDFDRFSFGLSAVQIFALDYFTLIIIMLLGFWYGIWIGLYWYDLVYEQQIHGGFIKLLYARLGSSSKERLSPQPVPDIHQRIKDETWQLEELAEEIPHQEELVTVPVKRRVARSRTTKTGVKASSRTKTV